MRTKDTTAALLPEQQVGHVADTAFAQIATIASLMSDGTPLLELDSTHQAAGRFAVHVTRERVEAAIAQRRQVVVVFEHGDRAKPLIVGFVETLDPQPVPSHDVPSEGAPVIEADVDGKRVRVTAQDEIVLECGSASITLRRNGRVVVRGTYVETRSEGTNRIKGGQVQIN